MQETGNLIEAMESKARQIAHAESPSELFHLLLDGGALAGPRAGLYLHRKGLLTGWGTRGFDREAAEQFQARSVREDGDWPAELLRPDGPETAERPDALTETRAHAVRVGGRVLAVVEIARDPGQEPWHPDLLGIMVRLAEMRLELDLARRKIDRLQQAAPPAPDPVREPEPEPAGPPEETVAAAPDADVPAEAEPPEAGMDMVEPAGDQVPEDPAHVAARRFARLVATDIRLYNEEAVMQGRKHRDLLERLKDQIERGTEAFMKRYPDLGDSGEAILRDAYVQVLGAGDASLFNESAG